MRNNSSTRLPADSRITFWVGFCSKKLVKRSESIKHSTIRNLKQPIIVIATSQAGAAGRGCQPGSFVSSALAIFSFSSVKSELFKT